MVGEPRDTSGGSSGQPRAAAGNGTKVRSTTRPRMGGAGRSKAAAEAPAQVSLDPGTGTPTRRPFPRWRGWLQRQRDDLIRDAVLGLVLLAVGAGFAAYYDRQLDQRAESSENTRFVRQAVIDGATTKPFLELNLRGASLAGLDLGCTRPDAARAAAFDDERVEAGCADFSHADLSSANLNRAVLRYALLTEADLRGANLRLADLGGAVLLGARLGGANLWKTDLREADLRGADMAGVDLSYACYDDTTQWVEGFTPAPADTAACLSHAERIDVLDDGGS